MVSQVRYRREDEHRIRVQVATGDGARNDRMKTIRHKIAHWLGLNLGRVVTWFDGDSLMVGFQCSTCGLVSLAHKRQW